MKEDVIKVINTFQVHGKIPKDFNAYFLTLVSKCDNLT